jgi:hypothetical protein
MGAVVLTQSGRKSTAAASDARRINSPGPRGAQPYEVPACSAAGASKTMHLSPGRAIHHLLQDYYHTRASGVTVLSVMLPCKSCRVLDVKQPPRPPLQSLHRHIKHNNLADT